MRDARTTLTLPSLDTIIHDCCRLLHEVRTLARSHFHIKVNPRITRSLGNHLLHRRLLSLLSRLPAAATQASDPQYSYFYSPRCLTRSCRNQRKSGRALYLDLTPLRIRLFLLPSGCTHQHFGRTTKENEACGGKLVRSFLSGRWHRLFDG